MCDTAPNEFKSSKDYHGHMTLCYTCLSCLVNQCPTMSDLQLCKVGIILKVLYNSLKMLLPVLSVNSVPCNRHMGMCIEENNDTWLKALLHLTDTANQSKFQTNS